LADGLMLVFKHPVNPIFGQSQEILSEFGTICDGHGGGGFSGKVLPR
jgi:hypothetical protein